MRLEQARLGILSVETQTDLTSSNLHAELDPFASKLMMYLSPDLDFDLGYADFTQVIDYRQVLELINSFRILLMTFRSASVVQW